MIPTTRIFVLLALLVPAAAHASPEKGYDVAEYLGMTLFDSVTMAPAGDRAAFVTSRDDVTKSAADQAIWLVATAANSAPVRVTHAAGAFGALRWSPSGRYLAFVAKRQGDDAAQLYVLDTHAGEPRRIASSSSFSNGIGAFDWDGSDDGLWVASPQGNAAAQAARKERYGEVTRYVTAPVGSEVTHIRRDDGAALATFEFPHRIDELRVSPDQRRIAIVADSYSPTYPFYDLDAAYSLWVDELGTATPPRRLTTGTLGSWGVAWEPDSRGLYAFTEGVEGATAFVYTEPNIHRFNVAKSGSATLMTRRAAGNFMSFVPVGGGNIIAATLESTHTAIYAIDARGKERRLREFPGRLQALTAASKTGPVAFVLSSHEAYPELYIADGPTKLATARKVTAFNEALTNQPRPTTQSVSWKTDDGTVIEGVLHWPPGRKGDQGLPLVVDIHGGPWGARTEALTTSLVYAYYPALVASRGYLAFEVNYRGSVGRGDDFARSINGHSCQRPAADILSGVDYLASQGWVDEQRMAVMGYSYGGLLTNCLIGLTTRFKTAISGAGVWDETAYFGAADNWFQSDVRIGGAPWERREDYWRQSAISRASQIKTPTLVVTGDRDRRVPPDQSISVFRALERLGVPAELLVFRGEGHVFTNPKHKYAAVMAELDWIDHYLFGTPRSVFVGPGPDADAHATKQPSHTLRALKAEL